MSSAAAPVVGAQDTCVRLTLPEAAQIYRTSARALRAKILAGRLPAAKVGRNYIVLRSDLESLFAPKLWPAPKPKGRESEGERIRRQLRNAGVAV